LPNITIIIIIIIITLFVTTFSRLYLLTYYYRNNIMYDEYIIISVFIHNFLGANYTIRHQLSNVHFYYYRIIYIYTNYEWFSGIYIYI